MHLLSIVIEEKGSILHQKKKEKEKGSIDC